MQINTKQFCHGSLFSGIGGFDLAAEWMGWENVFHCEWNEFGQKILKHYWPKAISYADITKTDFTIHRGNIDILTGGFPCQPYSLAGKRKGKEDERHLWPEMLRAIRAIQPTWVVGENVLGLINWSGGLVFDEVQADLEAEGYEVQPYVLPACAKNAPHRRDRVWFVAYSVNNNRRSAQGRRNEKREHFFSESERLSNVGNINETPSNSNNRSGQEHQLCTGWNLPKERINISEINSNTNGTGRKELNTTSESSKEKLGSGNAMYSNSPSESGQHIRQERKRKLDRPNSRDGINNWENFPTQSPICNGNDGISSQLDNITFPKWRNESIKAGGNAIVPAVALEIFKAIQKY